VTQPLRRCQPIFPNKGICLLVHICIIECVESPCYTNQSVLVVYSDKITIHRLPPSYLFLDKMNFLTNYFLLASAAVATPLTFHEGQFLFTTQGNRTVPILLNPYDEGGLNISPMSSIWDTYSSLGFVRDSEGSSRLISNRSLDQFSCDHCLDDSILRIPTRVGVIGGHFSTNMRATFFEFSLDDHGQRISYGEKLSAVPIESGLFLASSHFVLDVPRDMVDEINSRVTILDDDDENEDYGDYPRFGNCSIIRQQLPTIVISLSSGDRSKIEVRYTPDDYSLFVDEDADVCEIALEVTDEEPETAFNINIFFLKQTNFLFTKSYLGICQAL